MSGTGSGGSGAGEFSIYWLWDVYRTKKRVLSTRSKVLRSAKIGRSGFSQFFCPKIYGQVLIRFQNIPLSGIDHAENVFQREIQADDHKKRAGYFFSPQSFFDLSVSWETKINNLQNILAIFTQPLSIRINYWFPLALFVLCSFFDDKRPHFVTPDRERPFFFFGYFRFCWHKNFLADQPVWIARNHDNMIFLFYYHNHLNWFYI